MKIGLDFDNTIVSYDNIFYQVAQERDLIPADLPRSKLAVRDHLRQIGQEDIWTEMQGYVYGARMLEADAFPGIVEFLHWARQAGIETCIVSHKTKHPFLGHPYDLHGIARQWILQNLHDETGPLIPAERIYFELTKAEKLARIQAVQVDYFVDDLPEILTAAAFPAQTIPVLFDPAQENVGAIEVAVAGWDQALRLIQARCSTP